MASSSDTFVLTKEECTAIEQTWDFIREDLKGNGSVVFLAFFKKYPEYQKSFKAFAQVPLADLPGNKRFVAHAFTAMNSINGLVDSLDDVDMLTELLLKTGQNHAKRKLVRQDFQNFQDCLIEVFKKELPAKVFSGMSEKAWGKLLTHITDTISEGMDSLNY